MAMSAAIPDTAKVGDSTKDNEPKTRKLNMKPTIETEYQDKDGNPVDPGKRIVPDHYHQTFTVTIRTLTPISDGGLTDLIQKRWEVTACHQTKKVATVQ